MDRRTFILAGAASMAAAPALAQVGPDYAGNFAGLSGGKLISLERQAASQQFRVRGLGYGGADMFYDLPGLASPVRFKPSTVPEFVVRAPQTMDPQDQIGFFRLVVGKNARRLHTMKVKPMGFGTKQNVAASVPFEASKYGKDFFRFKPTMELLPGEYALTSSSGMSANGATVSQAIFLFGVDAA